MYRTKPDLTPGVLDGSALGAFKLGDCDILAVALHDATGWPIVAVTDAHNVCEGVACMGSKMHWMVRHPSGRLLDVDGLHDEQDVIDEYAFDADDGEAAVGASTREEALEEYEQKGGLVPLTLARTFVAPVLARIEDRGRKQ